MLLSERVVRFVVSVAIVMVLRIFKFAILIFVTFDILVGRVSVANLDILLKLRTVRFVSFDRSSTATFSLYHDLRSVTLVGNLTVVKLIRLDKAMSARLVCAVRSSSTNAIKLDKLSLVRLVGMVILLKLVLLSIVRLLRDVRAVRSNVGSS